jgi:glutaredoxin
LLVWLPACKRHDAPAKVEEAPPPPVLKDSSDGLLLTWIDEKGDFHIVEKVQEVPFVGRDVVRVVDPVTYDGTHPDRIFVADLRTAGPDGSYPLKVEDRAAFDSLAEGRRGKNGLTLANATRAPATSIPGASGAAAGVAPDVAVAGSDPKAAARPAVIVYGASWCGACHQAAAYLKRKGVAFVEKDIEEDANAAREMQAKLAHAGMHGGSIPVLDVRGRVMVGFNPQEVDSALGATL